jgi:hypothetical protein
VEDNMSFRNNLETKDMQLSEKDLKVLWECAVKNKKDFAGFKEYFSNGFSNGMSKLKC